jgi:ACS family glucarate transporter-like MFS transporter
MFVFLSWLPLYLMEAQHFSLAGMGVAAALPWAALATILLSSAFVSDRLVGRGVAKKKSRCLFGISGQMLCCIALYLAAVSTNPNMTVLWLTVSLGTLGLAFGPAWGACTDLGDRFTGSVSGWMNFWGNAGGFLAPIVTAWIATDWGWQAAIVCTAATALVGVAAWLFINPDVPLVPVQADAGGVAA